MPQLGDRKKRKGHWQFYAQCPECSRAKWSTRDAVIKPEYTTRKQRCIRCSKRCPLLKARRQTRAREMHKDIAVPMFSKRLDDYGYVIIKVPLDDPYASAMVPTAGRNQGLWVKEHRWVMACHLKRPLERWESVHHLSGDRKDNRIANLELWAKPSHGAGQRVADLARAYFDSLTPKEARAFLMASRHARLARPATISGSRGIQGHPGRDRGPNRR